MRSSATRDRLLESAPFQSAIKEAYCPRTHAVPWGYLCAVSGHNKSGVYYANAVIVVTDLAPSPRLELLVHGTRLESGTSQLACISHDNSWKSNDVQP